MDIKRVDAANLQQEAVPAKTAAKVKEQEAPASDSVKDKVSLSGESRSSRKERVRGATDRAAIKAASLIKKGSGAYVGAFVSTIIGWTVAGALMGPAGALSGAIAGAIAGARLGWKWGGRSFEGDKNKDAQKADSTTMQKIKGTAVFKKLFGTKETKASTQLSDDKNKITVTNKVPVQGKAEAKITKGEKGGIKEAFKDNWLLGTQTIKNFPKFIYPTIKSATAVEKDLIYNTLDSLPIKDAAAIRSIEVVDGLEEGSGVLGTTSVEIWRDSSLQFSKKALGVEGLNTHVITHEVGHAADLSEGMYPVYTRSTITPFGKEPYVIDPYIDKPPTHIYAATHPLEDFAQSYSFFHVDPEKLKAASPEKFAAIEKFEKGNIFNRLVDNDVVKTVGKNVGKAIDAVPGLRTTLEVAGQVMGPVVMNVGAAEWKKGVEENDAVKRAEGKLTLASGTASVLKLTAPVGLAIAGTNFVIKHALKKGKIKPETAEKIADNILAIVTGPIGVTVHCAVKEMLSAKGHEQEDIQVDQKLGFKDKVHNWLIEKKFIKGEIIKPEKGPAHPLTTKDKIFMAEVGTGATIGGAAGTILGWQGGTIAGIAIGAAVGGPVGAIIGGVVGKIGGMIGGSYIGAAGGAKLGHLLNNLHDPEKTA
ncbi:MAG: hypothetical protein M1269_02360 [Chloroflexi bacterium]|nr:hypothetical protein [Chloroflexota bacterium]